MRASWPGRASLAAAVRVARADRSASTRAMFFFRQSCHTSCSAWRSVCGFLIRGLVHTWSFSFTVVVVRCLHILYRHISGKLNTETNNFLSIIEADVPDVLRWRIHTLERGSPMSKPYAQLRAQMSKDAQRQAEDKATALWRGRSARWGSTASRRAAARRPEQARPRATREASNFSC